MIVRAVTETVDAAAFGLLAMIDGERVISDGARFGLKLAVTEGDQEEAVGGYSGGEDLHDIFRGIQRARRRDGSGCSRGFHDLFRLQVRRRLRPDETSGRLAESLFLGTEQNESSSYRPSGFLLDT